MGPEERLCDRLVLQRQIKAGYAGMCAGRRGAWRESGWPATRFHPVLVLVERAPPSQSQAMPLQKAPMQRPTNRAWDYWPGLLEGTANYATLDDSTNGSVKHSTSSQCRSIAMADYPVFTQNIAGRPGQHTSLLPRRRTPSPGPRKEGASHTLSRKGRRCLSDRHGSTRCHFLRNTVPRPAPWPEGVAYG